MSIAFAVAGPVPTPLPSEPASRGSALGRALFTVRGWLYIPFALFSLLWTRGEWEDELVLWPLGLAMIATGVWLRFAAIRRMGGAARTKKDSAKRLVTTGPYAWTRNPLYLANLTAFSGFVVLCELPWFAAISVLLLGAAYHRIAMYEESVLARQFGRDFEEYRARVPMWIPRPPRAAASEDPAGFYPLGKLLRRERGALLNVGCLVALALLKEFVAHRS